MQIAPKETSFGAFLFEKVHCNRWLTKRNAGLVVYPGVFRYGGSTERQVVRYDDRGEDRGAPA